MIKNHYKTLGVSPKATTDQIKKAYRKIVKKNHPDKNPDNPHALKIFRDATEAYDVISNEKERKLYNKKLKAEVDRQLEEIYRKENKSRHTSTSASSQPSSGGSYKYAKEAPTGFEASKKSVLGLVVSGLTLGGMALILLKRRLRRLKRDI